MHLSTLWGRLRVRRLKHINTRPATDADLDLCSNEDIREDLDIEDAQVHDGDLEIRGNFDFSEGELIVRGNLRVTGTISSDETGTLVVEGDLTCRNLYMEGSMEVLGEAKVHDVVFGFYEGGITHLHKVDGKVLILGDHTLLADRNGFGHVFTFENFEGELVDGTVEELRGILTHKGFDTLGPLIGLTESDLEDYEDAAFLWRGILR